MKEKNTKQVNLAQVTLAPEWYSRTNSGSCRPRTVFSLRERVRGQACRRAYSRHAAGPGSAGTAPQGSAGQAGSGIFGNSISEISGTDRTDPIGEAGDAG